MSVADELQRLNDLKEKGVLSASEFETAKAQLLNPAKGNLSMSNVSANQWAMILHLSQYAGYLVPFAGLICPILIWQHMKDDVPGLDEHGKNIANWMLSLFIYGIVSGLLTFVLIGFIPAFALVIMALVFPLIGAMKANDGIAWRYPTAIRFFQ